MKVLVTVVVALGALGWVAAQSVFIVPQAQQALVVRLGKPVTTIEQPGLAWKLPFIDSVVVYEQRLLPLSPPVDQVILGDQKRIEVETFSLFRIADPLRFYQSLGSEDQARSQLGQIVSTTLRKQLGQVALPVLLTAARDAVTARVRDEVARDAAPLGIAVVDVRIRRADLPVETSQAIYDRMTSERVREAKELRAEGFEVGQQIRAAADRDRAVLLSQAQRESQTFRGEGDAEANRIAAAAYARDPAFYDLYRTMQLYRAALTQGSPTMVLSPSSSLMRYFEAGPFPPHPGAGLSGGTPP
jgi:membrane protease subunit HflC